MKSKAWVFMPHTISMGDDGIKVENEVLPLVMCCDCIHYDKKEKWCQHMKVANDGYWFCADGKVGKAE